MPYLFTVETIYCKHLAESENLHPPKRIGTKGDILKR
jgi:hypothetical protein